MCSPRSFDRVWTKWRTANQRWAIHYENVDTVDLDQPDISYTYVYSNWHKSYKFPIRYDITQSFYSNYVFYLNILTSIPILISFLSLTLILTSILQLHIVLETLHLYSCSHSHSHVDYFACFILFGAILLFMVALFLRNLCGSPILSFMCLCI